MTLAHRFALANPLIRAEMIEAIEFPELANKFRVSGVPQTTINSGAETLIGASPEEELLAGIKQALSMD